MINRINKAKKEVSPTDKKVETPIIADDKSKKVIKSGDLKKREGLKKYERKVEGENRLNKFIANAGVCSRREADTLIAKGLITVNGKVVTEMGTMVSSKDEIVYNGKKLSTEMMIYVLLNKPKDVTTTSKDPHAKLTVMDIVRDACDERIYPVGRLDRATTGVLLLTNDGDLSKKLTHPQYNVKKIYHVHLDKPVAKLHLEMIRKGITLEDGPIKVDDISYVDDNKSEIGIEIHSGKNRIVRRIFEHFEYKVMKLDRVYFSGLTKKGVPRGRWRYLTDKEVIYLKTGMLS